MNSKVNGTQIQRRAGALLIFQALLIAIPFAVLGPAIGWPASLGEPGSRLMPQVHHHIAELRFGYGAYLAYSVLFAVTGAYTLRALSRELDVFALAAAVASSLARSLGILRWLTAMPVLAAAYSTAGASDVATLAHVFDALNAWGGGIGEVLGVSVFASLWAFRVAQLAIRGNVVGRGIGYAGFAASALLLLPTIELFGVDLGPGMMITGFGSHLFFVALGVSLFRSKEGV